MMTGAKNGAQESCGALIAAILTGAWRKAVPPAEISSQDLARIAPVLLASGSGALVWRKICNSSLRASPSSAELHEAYRLHSIQAAVHDQKIQRLINCLVSAGVRPLLGKGWAAARLYPEPGLRPYGDFDLYIPREQHEIAVDALKDPAVRGIPVDLHPGFAELDDRPVSELYSRARTVRTNEVDVPVFGPEDHLRLLCLHMLRHGAWRPLWLCDIAVSLEAQPEKFDWDYFLGGDARRADWSAHAVKMAHELLGAEIDSTGLGRRAERMPRWLITTVLRQWGSPPIPHGLRTPMASYLRRPAAFLRALAERWPNPIEATVDLRGSFNDLPRLPYQLGECVLRTARFAFQLKKPSRKPAD